MKFLDLFAGIGGFRLGLEQAGHTCVGFVEIDKFARRSYEAIFDSWYKEQYDRNFNIPNKIIENYAKIFYGDIEGNDDLSHKLMLWVAEYTYDGLSDTLCRQWREKLLKGIDAIMNGYEVEK